MGDKAHLDFKDEWLKWRSEYRGHLRCRNCGEIFIVLNKLEKDRKNCDGCLELKKVGNWSLFEEKRLTKKPEVRINNKCQNSLASWTPGYSPAPVTEGEEYTQVVEGFKAGIGPATLWKTTGVPLDQVYRILRENFDEQVIAEKILDIKKRTIRENREKARVGSGLEETFAKQLISSGFEICDRNWWISLKINGEWASREADIKVAYGDTKIIILCDGEAFHGPHQVFGDVDESIRRDRDTMLAFFDTGYSVVRYSESEINNNEAIEHFKNWVVRLKTEGRSYRNWCPPEELSQGGRG